jgi:hypothetical protein
MMPFKSLGVDVLMKPEPYSDGLVKEIGCQIFGKKLKILRALSFYQVSGMKSNFNPKKPATHLVPSYPFRFLPNIKATQG